MSLADYQKLLPRLVRETGSKITTDDFTRAIASAVLQYSQDVPRQVVRDIAWWVDGYINPRVPTGLTETSTVLQAEFPIGHVPPRTVGMALHMSTGALGLVCEQPLSAGDRVRLTFTAEHLLQDGADPQDTIPLRHRDAVLNYAAHLLCRELATLYAGERETSIGADGSNTESRARNYAARSKDYRAAYFAGVNVADPMQAGSGGGAGSSATSGAGAVTSWGSRARPSWRTNAGRSGYGDQGF